MGDDAKAYCANQGPKATISNALSTAAAGKIASAVKAVWLFCIPFRSAIATSVDYHTCGSVQFPGWCSTPQTLKVSHVGFQHRPFRSGLSDPAG